MARPKPATFDKHKTVAENRRARFDYFDRGQVRGRGRAQRHRSEERCASGEGSIAESYAEIRDGEAWLVNANIPEFSHGNRFNHEPKRPRKLLLHAREIEKMIGAVERKGMTLVPLTRLFQLEGPARRSSWRWPRASQTQDKRDRHQGPRLAARQGADHARARLGRWKHLKRVRSGGLRQALCSERASVYGSG